MSFVVAVLVVVSEIRRHANDSFYEYHHENHHHENHRSDENSMVYNPVDDVSFRDRRCLYHHTVEVMMMMMSQKVDSVRDMEILFVGLVVVMP